MLETINDHLDDTMTKIALSDRYWGGPYMEPNFPDLTWITMVVRTHILLAFPVLPMQVFGLLQSFIQ